MKTRLFALLLALVLICTALTGCDLASGRSDSDSSSGSSSGKNQTAQNGGEVLGFASVEGIPDYSGSPYVALNDNLPEFTAAEKATKKSYETYSPLDNLGRCGVTHACVGKDIMPTEKREDISSVKPSGWKNKAYDASLVDGRYLYNRCHLIGFQLTGENDNERNLITGTRYMNVEGMLPFENMVADYVKETGNHVMYRVTPIFVGDNLVASGCQMEAWSVEDNGEGICFNVFVYNVQPGICINYATGDNWLNTEEKPVQSTPEGDKTQTGEGGEADGATTEGTYILNTNTKRIHLPTCSSVQSMSSANRREHSGAIDALLAQGYKTCGTCMK